MIKLVTGDILLSKAAVIAHSIAPLDHFDSGLALSLRENYPSMVKDFRHYCHTHSPKPGEIFEWGGADGKRIISLMGQEPVESVHSKGHPGKAKLQYIDKALKKLAQKAEEDNYQSLALPKLATGVGGLEWDEVLPLIEKHFSELEIPVFVYDKYVKGQSGE